MPHEGDAKIRIVLAAVIFAQTDDVGGFPRGEDPLDDAGMSFLGRRHVGIRKDARTATICR